MKKTKILWVSNTVGVGGSERQLINMYHTLKEYNQYDIRVLYYAKAEHELPLEGIETIYVDKGKVGQISTILKIHRYIKANRIQIVHALGGCTANIYGRAGAVLSSAIPVGAMKGKTTFDRLGNRIANSILNLFGNWWMVNNRELIPLLKKNLLFVNDKKIRMLHNGFVTEEQIDYRKGEITEYDQAKGDCFVFCAIGRLQPVKNYTLLIEAAERLLQQHKTARFWIIGYGDEYNKLKRMIEQKGIQDYINLWGYRSDTDVALSRCDAFVQTSISEGTPNTIIEAMRAKKPIVSTKCTDLSEMIEPGENGEIVDGSAEELSNAMEKILLASDYKRECMGQHSYKLFMRYYQDHIVAKEYIDFYDELLERKVRRDA